MVSDFSLSQLPEIYFGTGSAGKIFQLAARYGNRVLIITGSSSLSKNVPGKKILEGFDHPDIRCDIVTVGGEPSVSLVDNIAETFKEKPPDVVISIGGGSVLDAGKAISAMIPVSGKTWDYLEGNPAMKEHPGTRLPLIAVPTTSGTGSEVTKNAVLSTTGEHVLKRSLRHDKFVPDIALVDPELALECPAGVSAASGLDAITQLLEAYVSTRASAITDALALGGIEHGVRSILRVVEDGRDIKARSDMAYASMISGIVLANAGLGAVHGFASVLGGHYGIPHGVICGTLLGAVTRVNIEKLGRSDQDMQVARKYSRIGKLFCPEVTGKSDGYYLLCLADTIDKLIDDTGIPRLGRYGVKEAELASLASETEIKNNPVCLQIDDLQRILLARL